MKVKNTSPTQPASNAVSVRWLRATLFVCLALLCGASGMRVAFSQGALPDVVDLGSPPSAKQEEPSNVSLALSVEFPTVGAAYRNKTDPVSYNHDPKNNPYIGYWDVNGCYKYKESGDSSPLGGEYFYRVDKTNPNGYCSEAYSGNLLNFVATSAIDILRLALTGGNRVLDTPAATVLERAYLYNTWGLSQSYFPERRINKSYLGKVMPSAPNGYNVPNEISAGSCLDKIWFDTTKAAGATCNSLTMYARVKVCSADEAQSRTDLCARYPSGYYKPIGEIQRKSEGTRLAAFGYLAEDKNGRYGGVLRAPMGYVGPLHPNSSGILVPNSGKEWDLNSGVFSENPKNASGYAYSGVINYLNRFGTTGTKGYYKSNDPVGELYYESLRYYMGLGPTDAAISGAAKDDGFPFYKKWADPISNACQRKNFILVIGDVNTHADKQLPGHGGSGAVAADGDDSPRSEEKLLGGGTFNAVDWTKVISKFETDADGAYRNSFGVDVSTKGNKNSNLKNVDLNNKKTGAGSAAYYWAGAAYWAHTQAIRNDKDAEGKSKSVVRVNTFTIDVDENGNGSIDYDNRNSVGPRQSSFYLAGKYGWFNNTDASKVNRLGPLLNGALGSNEQLDGHPFRNVLTGALDNSRWEYPGAPNTPDGYVLASDAKKMIEGVSRFFNSIGGSVTPNSVIGLSSVDFSTSSPDGALFVPQFDSKTWAGRLVKAKVTFNQITGDVAVTSSLWDAAKILTDASVATGGVSDPQVKPANRKLFTYSRDGVNRGGQVLSVAQKGNLDAAVRTALATRPAGAPVGISDSDMQDATLNWLRGDRSLEAGAVGGYLRSRNSVLGAIVNSGPVYKQGASEEVGGEGFAQFAQAQKDRAGTVYVGANDGFLHAFRASDGKELFAYMPRAVAELAHRLAAPGYTYQPLVDAIPLVTEAQQVDGDGNLQWKTLLVSGMGGGAQGVFALDVTDPGNFAKNNVLFEFTDQDDADMGNVLGSPRLVRMMIPGTPATYRWFVAVSSGYNNYQNDGNASADGTQALFLLSVDKDPSAAWVENNNYFKMKVAKPDGTKPAALTNPGVALDAQGNAIVFYAGDTYGKLWKFDFQLGLDAAKAAIAVKKSGSTPVPLAILQDDKKRAQALTTVPQVAPGLTGGYMVIFGTGKYIEVADAAAPEVNSVYGIWDNLDTKIDSYKVQRASLYKRTFKGDGTVNGDATFAYTNEDKKRGWYVDLPTQGERVVVEADTRYGYTAVNSFVPPADCTANGTGTLMTFDNLYGTSRSARDERTRPLSRPRIVALDMSGTDSHTYTRRQPSGRRDLTIVSRPVSALGGSGSSDPNVAQGPQVTIKIPGGRVGWREIKNFEKTD